MKQDKFDQMLETGLDHTWPGKGRWQHKLAEQHEDLETRIKCLEQFHCDHEFSSHSKGCLESLLCSKCDALHPDWMAITPSILGNVSKGAICVKSKWYAPKPDSMQKEED